MRRAALLLAILLTAAPAAAAPAKAYRVTADTLTVRTSPGGNATIGTARKDDALAVVDRKGDWAQVQFGTRKGWVLSRHLRASSDPVRYVVDDRAPVHSGPAGRFRDLGVLQRGEPVVVRDEQPSWRRIDYGSRVGWVHLSHLGATPPRPKPRPRSRAGFIQLSASGPGRGTYTVSSERWGRPRLVYGLERVGRAWQHPQRPRMMIGDMARQNGGYFPPHASHRDGRDVDVLPVRSTKSEAGVTIYDRAYSRARTRTLIGLFRRHMPIALVLFNDRGVGGVTPYPNHHHHFHARVR